MIKYMRIRITFFLLIVSLARLSIAGEWFRSGPVAGTVLDIAADRRHCSLWYAINGTSAYGRLYRSTDNGESWIPTRIDRATSVVVSPASSEVIVLGLAEDGSRLLWVSSDQGNTFSLQSSQAPLRVFAHPSDPSILFGVSDSTPYNLANSYNRGRTWEPVTTLPYKPGNTYDVSPNCEFYYYQINDVLISPIDGKTVYATGEIFFKCGSYDIEEQQVMFRSKNLGRSWKVSEFNEYNFSYDPAFPNRAFSFNNSDSGASNLRVLTEKGWRNLSHQRATSLAAMPNRPDELYAYRYRSDSGGAEHFVSRDMGHTWRKIKLGPGNGIRLLVGRQTPEGTLLGGTNGGGLYSLDERGRWKAQQKGFREATLIDVAGGPPSSILYAISRGEACCGSDSYLYRSTNNGRSWENITNHLPTTDAAANSFWGLITNVLSSSQE